MIRVVRTNASDTDFRKLVASLDQELAVLDGADHAFYAQFNTLDAISHAVVAYLGLEAVGCGAFKPFDARTVEVKRMYVLPTVRGRGIAGQILTELETLAAESGYAACVLETGLRQPEAVRLYEKNGYVHIPNYGQYVGDSNSVCLRKEL
jgi:putative acetyltransferase